MNKTQIRVDKSTGSQIYTIYFEKIRYNSTAYACDLADNQINFPQAVQKLTMLQQTLTGRSPKLNSFSDTQSSFYFFQDEFF